MSKLWTSVAVLVVIAAALAFTAPGHRVLHTLGVTAACGSEGNCD